MRSYWIARTITAAILAILVGSVLTDRAGLVAVAVCALMLQVTLLNVAVYYLFHRSEEASSDRQFIVDTLIHIFVVFLILAGFAIAVSI